MVGGTGNACSAINCSNNQKKTPHLSFFRFPKDPERSKRWLINCRREDLVKKDTLYLYNNVKFCSLHFEQNQFMNAERKKLVWNAVPTLFEIPNKPPQVSFKRKLPQRTEEEASKIVKMCCATEENSVGLESAATSVPQTSECATQTNFEDELVKLKQIIDVLEKRVKCKNVRIARLSLKLKQDKGSAYSYRHRKKLSYQKDTVKKDKQIVKNIASRYLKKDALDLLLSQIR